MAKVAPSLLAADFGELKGQIEIVEREGADYLHIDVMDGIYVPNISFGPPVIKRLRQISKIPFDVHLMIDRPERYIKDFVDSGADIITIHQESTIHLHRTIQEIKSYGIKAGVSLNPATPIETIEYVLGDIDLLLIMTVNPGFGGQGFIESMKDKIVKARTVIDQKRLDIILQVDGGIKLNNAKEILELGADLLVSGSDIFSSPDIGKRVKEYKNL